MSLLSHLPVCPLEGDPQAMREAFERFGACLVRDDRIPEQLVTDFQDIMQEYFARPEHTKVKDVRKEIQFQVGYLPPGVETPRCAWAPDCQAIVDKLDERERPIQVTGPDPKARFHWKVCGHTKSSFASQSEENIIPSNTKNFKQTMDQWGTLLVSVCHKICTQLEQAYSLPPQSITSMCEGAPNLLAPTGIDVGPLPVGSVCAGFHYDIDVLTIHGKSRFPGLNIWVDGKRVPVSVPDGCLLVQAGRQLEVLTSGNIMAGYHEVVVTEATRQRVEQVKKTNGNTYRVSSTVFYHLHPDQCMAPLVAGPRQYQQQQVGEFMKEALTDIYPESVLHSTPQTAH